MNTWMLIHMKAGAYIYKIAKEQEYAFLAWLWLESLKKKKSLDWHFIIPAYIMRQVYLFFFKPEGHSHEENLPSDEKHNGVLTEMDFMDLLAWQFIMEHVTTEDGQLIAVPSPVRDQTSFTTKMPESPFRRQDGRYCSILEHQSSNRKNAASFLFTVFWCQIF